MNQAVSFLIRIHDVPGFNLWWETCSRHRCFAFAQFFRENAGMAPQIGSAASFQILFSLLFTDPSIRRCILLVLTASLN